MRETVIVFGCLVFAFLLFPSAVIATKGESSSIESNQSSGLAARLGIHFLEESTTKVIIERDGQEYEVDLATKQIRSVSRPPQTQAPAPKATVQQKSTVPTSNTDQRTNSKDGERRYYHPGDDLVFTLPTGRPIEKHSWMLNFTHRFPYEAAFTGPARGATLLGLDDFAVASFGVQFGVTGHLSVSAYRSPSVIGRPIELGARYNFLDEQRGPLNAAFRFSVQGQDNFSRNFTENFELIASRSLGHRAQLYLVPTFSLHNRPVLSAKSALTEPPFYQPCGQPLANGVAPSMKVQPCADTFSVGFGAAVDIRPTVAFVGEVIPTAVNGTDLGIHRMPFSFGIQAKIYHHAFTFGFTTAPGTTTAQRIATRAIFLPDPKGDTPSGMFVGFDIMRQLP